MKFGRILLLLVFIGLAVVIIVNKCGKSVGPPNGQGGPMGKQAMTVSGVVIHAQSISDRILTTGSLLANNSIEVRNEVAGRLAHLYFEEGQRVEQGALLVKIQDDDLQAQLRKSMTDRELAAKIESRQKDLLAASGVSQQDYDAALTALHGIDAGIDLLKAQVAKTEIHAPFAGVVGLRSVSEGAYLSAFTTIVMLQQLDPMKLDFTVPERYRDRLKVRDTVSFQLESDKGMRTATVYAFEPSVDPVTRSLKARALCKNPEHDLLSGAFAKVVVPLREIDNALMLPTQAVIPELLGQKVIVSRNGKATPVKVEIGLRNDTTVQVTSGLQVGDTVIISGIMQLRPDMSVHVNVISGTGQGK